jgi:hypothetical protein
VERHFSFVSSSPDSCYTYPEIQCTYSDVFGSSIMKFKVYARDKTGHGLYLGGVMDSADRFLAEEAKGHSCLIRSKSV